MSSMSYGGEASTDPLTMRGRDWPCLRQFCVFLENRVGRLNDLLRHLEGSELRVVALSIVNAVECAVARVMLNDFERGRESFALGGFHTLETDIIGVELPEGPRPFVTICKTLLQAEMNIHYTYPLLYRRGGRGAIALYVDDIDMGLSILAEKGHRLISERDLLEDDDY